MVLNGYALKALRLAHGRTGTSCASAIGVSLPTWSNWERGERNATPANVLAICETLAIADHRAILANPSAVDMAELAS